MTLETSEKITRKLGIRRRVISPMLRGALVAEVEQCIQGVRMVTAMVAAVAIAVVIVVAVITTLRFTVAKFLERTYPTLILEIQELIQVRVPCPTIELLPCILNNLIALGILRTCGLALARRVAVRLTRDRIYNG
jgi:hypothetical protein